MFSQAELNTTNFSKRHPSSNYAIPNVRGSKTWNQLHLKFEADEAGNESESS